MSVTFELFGTVEPLPPVEPRPTLSGRVTSTELGSLHGTTLPSDDLAQGLAPSTREQVVHTEARIGGPAGTIYLTADDIVDWSWSEDEDGTTWSITVAGQIVTALDRWGSGPVGTEVRFAGAPPPGRGGVDVVCGIETILGEVTDFYVIRGGLSTSSTRPVIGSERVMRLEGVGYWGRIDRKEVSLSLPPLHGLTHGELAGEILTLLGLSASQLPGSFGTALLNPVNLSCEQGWPKVREIFDGAGYWPRFDQANPPRVEPVALIPPAGASPRRTFTAADFLAGQTGEVETDGDVATTYIVTGSVVELPAGGEGAVTTVSIVELWDDFFVIPQAVARQVPNPAIGFGDIVAMTPDLTPSRQLTQRITTRQTKVAGCLRVKEVITERWHAPEAARYVTGASGNVYREVFFYEDGVAKDDEAAGYEIPAHVFGEVTRVVEESFWGTIPSTAGLTAEQVAVISRDTGAAIGAGGLLTAKRPGDLMMVVTQAGAWYNPQVTLGTDPDAPDTGVNLTGGGVGVLYDAEGYFEGPTDPPFELNDMQILRDRRKKVQIWLSVDREVIGGDAEGYLDETIRTGLKFARTLKAPYLYADDVKSSEEREVGRIDETESKLWTAGDARSHTEVLIDRDINNRPTREQVSFKPEYKPRRPYCDADDAIASSRRPVSGEHTCNAQSFHAQGPEIIDHAFVESDEDALRRAEIECVRDQAPSLSATILVDPALRVGDPVVVDLPDAELANRKAWVHKLDASKPARSPGGRQAQVLMPVVFRLDPRE